MLREYHLSNSSKLTSNGNISSMGLDNSSMVKIMYRLHRSVSWLFHGHVLVVIDSHTKLLEVFLVKAATSFHTNKKLRMLFS